MKVLDPLLVNIIGPSLQITFEAQIVIHMDDLWKMHKDEVNLTTKNLPPILYCREVQQEVSRENIKVPF